MSSNPKEERTTTEELPKAAPFPGDLRDYFAAAALTGLLAGSATFAKQGVPVDRNEDTVSQFAYTTADAMMKAREK